METRANYISVGFFTLLALVVTFALIYWFGRYGDNTNLIPLDVRIQGSVSGLGPGSVVQFNGINVGRVKGLSLDSADPRFVIVHTEVNEATPVRADTRANIGIRGLSGGAFIQLEGGSPSSPAVIGGANVIGKAPEIQGDPAALSDLLTRINGIAARTEQVMNTLEQFVSKNNVTVTQTFENAEIFSRALADNSDGVARFLDGAGKVATSLEQLSEKLDGSISRAEEILNAVDPNSINKTVKNVEDFTQSLADQRQQITNLIEVVNQSANQLDGFTKNLNTTLEKVDGVVSAVNPQTFQKTVQDISDAAKGAQTIVADVAKITTPLSQRSKEFEQIVSDTSKFASGAKSLINSVDENEVRKLISGLGQASDDVSKLLAAIDASKINGAVDDISKAAKGAQTIVTDVAKVTQPFGQRSNEIEAIITDASQLAARLNETSKKIDQVVDNANAMLQSSDGEGLVGDARRTLAEFRRSARNFNVQISSIANSVTGFTRRGLGDTQSLIRDARQSLNRIDRVMRNLESNPSSLITGAGGSRIRETSGGRPRR